MREPAPIFPTAFKYGLLMAILSIILSIVFYILGVKPTSSLNYALVVLGYVITFSGIFLAQKTYRDNVNHGVLSFGSALGIGMIAALVLGVIAAIYSYVFVTFIDPTFVENMLIEQEQLLEEKGLSDEEIEMSMKIGRMFSGGPAMIIVSIIGKAVTGFIASLIGGLIFKRESNDYSNLS